MFCSTPAPPSSEEVEKERLEENQLDQQLKDAHEEDKVFK